MLRSLFCSFGKSLCLISVATAVCTLAPASFAQVATGTPPFGSFGGAPDVVNLANLNDHHTIPIIHKAGRGTDFTYGLSYDSSVWYPVGVSPNQLWQPVSNWGWASQTQGPTGYIAYNTTQIQITCTTTGGFVYKRYYINQYTYTTYYDQFGAGHTVNATVSQQLIPGFTGCSPNPAYPYSKTVTANDGSGLTFSLSADPSAIIHTTSGTDIYPSYNQTSGSGSFTDRNGNIISASSGGVFTDTLGKTALTVSGSGTVASPMKFTYTSPSGTSAFYQINYTNYTVATNFGVSGISEYKSSAAVPLVSSVVLPDGSQYSFSYESTPGTCTPYSGTTCVTARIASVTLPTGGKISYSYSFAGCTTAIFKDGSAACLQRITPDGTSTYARTMGTGSSSATLTTDPLGNQTILQFQGIYATQRDLYQGSAPTFTSVPIAESTLQTASLLQEIQTCYNAATLPCTGTTVSLPILQETVIATLPGPGKLQSQRTQKFDSYGNLIETDEYNLYVSGSTPPLLRQTLITMANLGGYLHSFTQTVKVLDGSGNIKSRVDKNYDQYVSFTGSNCITGAPQHNDTSYGCSYITRANLTSIVQYTDPVTPGGAITKTFAYDSLGNMRTAQLNCCQLKTWAYSSTTAYSYADSITSGSGTPSVTTSMTYDLNMGLILTSTDPNSVKTTFTYDSMGRPLSMVPGSNPGTQYTYNDSGSWSVQVCSPVQGTSTACQKAILDGLGRPTTNQFLDGSGTLYSASDTQYDQLGRAYKTSNPYTTSASYWTQTTFDPLGRVTKTTLPDNSASTASYTDNTATMSDPAGKQRKKVFDGLGRLTSVYEPDPTSGNSLTLQTSYTYNVFDGLTTITQGTAQTRTYNYDALGRVTSTTTPEAGTVCFGTLSGSTCQPNGYDSFDNLLYRTDARGVQTNYIYDSLNRLVGISYSNVPSSVSAMPNVCATSGTTNNANVCLTYGTNATGNNNGRLTSMTDPSGSESYTYDQFGNVTQLAKAIGSTTYTTSYAYNLASELIQITYPSGRVVQENLDAIGRIGSVVGTLNSVQTTYASGFLYNTAQQATGFQYGNGLFASYGFSADRLQLTCLDYSTSNRNGSCAHDSTTKFGLSYSYGSAGSNNGQIASITDSVDNGRNATYTYDSLYRLTQAATTGSTNYPTWGLQWTYDSYGNRKAQQIYSGCSGITCPTNSVTISTSTNQITGSPYTYDVAGNMTDDGSNALTYDGAGRVTQAAVSGSSSGTYTYDGNGLRVEKVSTLGSTTTTTVYVFSGSKVIAEYDNGASASSASREYIYSGAKLIAQIDSNGTRYYHQDHLSNRLATDSSGNKIGEQGHFPFGEQWYPVPPASPTTKWQFTSYERDAESGNDYAAARYDISRLGRFASPDPMAGSTANPQSLNRFSYVQNDPINLVDPFGLSCSLDTTGHWETGTWSDGTTTSNWIDDGMVLRCDPDPGQGGGGPPNIGGGPVGGGSTFGSLLGPLPQPAPPPGYEKCIAAALREMVADDEGTAAQPNGGYGTLVGGTVRNAPHPFHWIQGRFFSWNHPWNMPAADVSSLTGHPDILVDAGYANSTAFGRYMFTVDTWRQFGSGGMTPAAQDQAMNNLMDYLGMIQDAMSGPFSEGIVQAIWDGNRRWASLPDSPANQPTKSWAETIDAFHDALKNRPECQ
ncbi:MAG: hypothetical protein DMG38_09035 [Acidobacteria bacterium]|nr:MAG: hypothetical protein DMG38_09035 [Acidobacteriota bacterium]